MKTAVLDAWRMIVPLPNDRHGPLSPLLLSLTFLTGLVDAFSYLVLGHVFVANMTGNVVFSGLRAGWCQGLLPAHLDPRPGRLLAWGLRRRAIDHQAAESPRPSAHCGECL
jgi:Protein of unknown function (DUF1275)